MNLSKFGMILRIISISSKEHYLSRTMLQLWCWYVLQRGIWELYCLAQVGNFSPLVVLKSKLFSFPFCFSGDNLLAYKCILLYSFLKVKMATYDTWPILPIGFLTFKTTILLRESYDLRKGNNPFGAKKQVGSSSLPIVYLAILVWTTELYCH